MGVERFGVVRITYELGSYPHGRARYWHWRAVRADPLLVLLARAAGPLADRLARQTRMALAVPETTKPS